MLYLLLLLIRINSDIVVIIFARLLLLLLLILKPVVRRSRRGYISARQNSGVRAVRSIAARLTVNRLGAGLRVVRRLLVVIRDERHIDAVRVEQNGRRGRARCGLATAAARAAHQALLGYVDVDVVVLVSLLISRRLDQSFVGRVVVGVALLRVRVVVHVLLFRVALVVFRVRFDAERSRLLLLLMLLEQTIQRAVSMNKCLV